MSALHDINLTVKNASERAIKYLLGGGTNSTLLNQLKSQLDNDKSRFLNDYYKRIISNLSSDDSDDENIN